MSDQEMWVGKDEHFGVPSLERPDAPEAASWSLEAVATVERPHDATLSPDGSTVAMIVDRDTSDVWTVAVDGRGLSRITTGRELTAYWEDDAPTWSPDGSHLAFSSEGMIWTVPSAGGKPKEIGEGSTPIWIGDEELVFTHERDEKSRLVRAGVADAWPVPVSLAGQNVSGAWASPEHRVVLYVDYPSDDRSRSDIWVHHLESGESRRISGEAGLQDRCPRLSPDGTTVAFVSERTGWDEIHLVAIDGSDLRRLTSGDADFSGLAWSDDGTRLLASRTRHGVDDLVAVDVASGDVSTLASGGEWMPVGWSGSAAVCVHEAYDTPPRVVTVPDAGDHPVTVFESVPAQVRVARHVGWEEVTYESLDGMQIHGFLFRPDAADTGPVPAVVYPHGGPTGAYGDYWDGHAQYFIDKGYAWFGINFRGSTGYGRDFERANYGVWGVRDTDDCLAAADYLAALGWVDPARIAIFGASYGSYLALASLARDPEHRFACGVAKYGDSDIATSWAQGDRGGREDIEKMMGTPAENRQAYRDGSPLWSVAAIERPILVAHGERDERVHPDQSEQLVAELKRLGKTFEYITYPTEAHGLLRFEPQVHFYKRLERFLDWHLM